MKSKIQKQKTECNLELVSKSDSVFENIETVKSIEPYNFNFVEGFAVQLSTFNFQFSTFNFFYPTAPQNLSISPSTTAILRSVVYLLPSLSVTSTTEYIVSPIITTSFIFIDAMSFCLGVM